MPLKSLRLFIDVIETGSFVAAADRQHTVQSNVTAHIKKLEDELGVRLFFRKGGIQLTAAGSLLETHARQILQSHDDTLDLFHGNKMLPGKLRLGSMEPTAAVRLPEVLAEFYRRHPGIELLFETGTSAELVNKLLDSELDGAFIAGQPECDQVSNKKVFSDQLVLVGPDPLQQFPCAEELASATFLAFRQGGSYRQRMELFLSTYGIATSKVFEFGSIDGILGCVAAGMGYTLMPLSTVKVHSHRFAIDYLELPVSIATIDTCFTTAPRETWAQALNLFVDMLEQHKIQS